MHSGEVLIPRKEVLKRGVVREMKRCLPVLQVERVRNIPQRHVHA